MSTPPAGCVSLGDGVLVADSTMAGYPGMNGVFLIPGARPALIETGTALSVARTRAALDAFGLAPGDLGWIIVTHVHLDHAGGAGALSRAFPAAKVVVHPFGARHLADPARLEASARRVHGALLDRVYGSMTPVEGSRIQAAEDGARIDLGDRELRILHTPGHAPHHLVVLDAGTGVLFTGDAAGVRVDGMRSARPACPPPHFDRDAAVASMRRMAELRPARLVLTHFGDPGDPAAFLADAEDRLQRWCTVAERSAADGLDEGLEAELLRRFAAEEGMPADEPERFAVMGGFESNAAGLRHWLRMRNEERE
ncbi:MBL fold metallo-hydrolase [Streptomyces inhibens]|uniref:MBL fold metallo-hydrolase n=1 Tax=Streptomyces inhibens TaxID=2293571 RepID=UPI001EE75966|nr:MBL fold metallo-hydrolase [Streptomyces inhibens]UKY53214.1 MBL fold metallo-hydrolase [Streptomyces inhibens]